MGEIGRDRREYLYDMMYWEIALIIRGYRRRNILQYQLQRLQAYGAFHCMGGSKKKPAEWLPLYVDRYKDPSDDGEPISEEEVQQIQQEMAEYRF